MTEETTRHGHPANGEVEQQDLRPSNVYAFLIGLAVAGFLVYLALWGLYHFLDAYQSSHQPPQNPLAPVTQADTRETNPAVTRTEIDNRFPQPRLERNERLEINDFLVNEEQTLNGYDWVDQKSGVMRIPIERAMELVAQRGLPTTPKLGEVPPSEVNVVNQAAKKADLSNIGKKQEKK